MERRVKANLVAVASTDHWYWFVDGLRSQGREVRVGTLPENYVYPPD